MPNPRLQTVEQVSFSTVETGVVVVTGQELYRYLKLDGPNLKIVNYQVNKRDQDAHFSNNYTCHTWLSDGRFVICNDHGQIMLLESTGEYKGITVSDPRKDSFPITAITTFSGVQQDASGQAVAVKSSNNRSGFIVAGESGRMRVFVKSDADLKKPYVRVDTTDDLVPPQGGGALYGNDNNPSTQMISQDIGIHKVTSI